MDVPLDMVKLILNNLSIIDQRNLIRSCKQLYQLHPLMNQFEQNFMELITKSKFVTCYQPTLTQFDKYVLEYLYCDAENMPERYFCNVNIFTEYSLLYLNITSEKVCMTIYEKGYADIHLIMTSAASNGNLDMLIWAYEICHHWYVDTYAEISTY